MIERHRIWKERNLSCPISIVLFLTPLFSRLFGVMYHTASKIEIVLMAV